MAMRTYPENLERVGARCKCLRWVVLLGFRTETKMGVSLNGATDRYLGRVAE